MDMKHYDSIMIRDLLTNEIQRVRILDLEPLEQLKTVSRPDAAECDPEKNRDMRVAQARLAILQPYLELPRMTRKAVEELGKNDVFDLSTSGMYALIARYKNDGQLTALFPHHPTGGAGKKRLPAEREELIEIAIKYYCDSRQPSLKATMREVRRIARDRKIKAPDRHTVSSRIRALPPRVVLSARSHGKLADDLFRTAAGSFDDALAPRAVVQIDHKKLDIILVDEETGQQIGKPWLTVVFDVCTRMVLGMHLSLNHPSAITAGAALIHAIMPKEKWLADRGIDIKWNCYGWPETVHADNGPEFRGQMLLMAAAIHNFSLQFRRIYTAPDGGHLERCLGGFPNAVHKLHGTTFSNPEHRGSYKSEKEARWTLRSLEKWLVLKMAEYHKEFHEGIRCAPENLWNELIFGTETKPPLVGVVSRPRDDIQTRLDFHPFVMRTIQREGVRIGNPWYWHDDLIPLIGAKEPKSKLPKAFRFRYDPSDFRVVWCWNEKKNEYIPIRAKKAPPIIVSMKEDSVLQAERRKAGLAAIDHDGLDRLHVMARELEDKVLRSEVSPRKTVGLRRRRERRRLNAELRVVDDSYVTPQLDTTPVRDLSGFEIEDA